MEKQKQKNGDIILSGLLVAVRTAAISEILTYAEGNYSFKTMISDT